MIIGNITLWMMTASVTGSQSTVTSPTVPNGHTITSYQNSGHEMSMNIAESRTIRKSHTVSADLTIKAVENSLLSGGEIIRNGKRKDENTAISDIGELFVSVILMGLSLYTNC